MTRESIYFYTSQILKIIHYYIYHEKYLPHQYQRGLNEIHKIIFQCYEKIENIYYRYAVKPSLEYFIS
jgi:hypothetical protein